MSRADASAAVAQVQFHLVCIPRQLLPGPGFGLWSVVLLRLLIIFFYVFFTVNENAGAFALGTCGFMPFWARNIIFGILRPV